MRLPLLIRSTLVLRLPTMGIQMNHDYSKGQMIGLAVGFIIIPTFFYALRLWAKMLVAGRFAWDDYLTGLALVST